MVVSNIFYFHPLLGEDSHFFLKKFQRGWFNHQLVKFFIDCWPFNNNQKRGIHYQPWDLKKNHNFFWIRHPISSDSYLVIWLYLLPSKKRFSAIFAEEPSIGQILQVHPRKEDEAGTKPGSCQLEIYGDGPMIHPDSVFVWCFFWRLQPAMFMNALVDIDTRQIWGSCLSWHLVVDFFF